MTEQMSIAGNNGRHSAYPSPVDELLPRAVALADEVGDVPSLRRLISELRIGAPKARAVAQRLAEIRCAKGAEHPVSDEEIAAAAIVHAVELPGSLADPDAALRLDTDTPPPAPPSTVAEPDTMAAEQVAAVAAGPATKSEAAVPPDAPASATRAVPTPSPRPRRPWPLVLLALPAFVAVWSGWVGIGRLTGFGLVNLLPGIVADGGWATIDTAITLPIGVEAYGAYALSVWLAGAVPARARRFAFFSAIGSLLVGMAGQGAYHLMIANPGWLDRAADGTQSAPWPIVVLVSCLPVAVLGMGAALAHLVRAAAGGEGCTP